MRNRCEKGMALATALLVMLLLATMVIGLSWLVVTDTKLGGNNSDRQSAYYGAEAGMEALTASLENTIASNNAPTAAVINGLATGMPAAIAPYGINYYAQGSTTANSGFSIAFNQDAFGNPAASWSTIPSGTYAGLIGLETPYTLTVIAQAPYKSEVKLQREVQTVLIPVFQFGMFSQMDLSFFAGPNFSFGGRVHTNGNLWLAEDGATLTLSDKTTAAGEIITSNLENGYATTANYNTTVNITTNPGSGNYADLRAQTPPQSVTGTNNVYGAINPYNPAFATMASGVYGNNIGVKETGIKPLNVTIATPAIGGQEIDLIRPPLPGEAGTLAGQAKLAERLFDQASLRILLSDYGNDGTCATSDIMNMPHISAGNPIDLATLAWDTTAHGGVGVGTAAPGWVLNAGTTVFPLPVSAAANNATYTANDGYWIQKWYPIITGCIKIDYPNTEPLPTAWTDVTKEILNLGFTGENLYPQTGAGGVPAWVAPPTQPALPTTALGQRPVSGCLEPSPNAVIRLARLRDNPSTAAGGNNWCGNTAATHPSQHGYDYWPNVLWDTREGVIRDNALAGNAVTLAGAMNYIELDVANLAAWFTGGGSGPAVPHTNGFSVYFSDRRGNMPDNTPAPASVGGGTAKSGGFGYEDIVNLNDAANGCPNNALDQGEDVESDYTGGASQTPQLRTYGKQPTFFNPANPVNAMVLPVTNAYYAAAAGTFPKGAATINIIAAHPVCAGAATGTSGIQWPFAVARDPQDLRENPPLVFRRTLKLVNGTTINLGTCANIAEPCGLTVVAENPVYIQSDYNNPGLNTAFTGVGVAASVIADSVTLLSRSWNDVNSFAFPYTPAANRNATTTTYRLAISGGKGIPFPLPAGNYRDYGTDGGAHNFLRFLEDWSGQTLYYRGSIVTFYYSHQAQGTYKCCTTVYSPPTRGYNFDANFLTPAMLPPLTPMMRTINTIGSTQMILPTQ